MALRKIRRDHPEPKEDIKEIMRDPDMLEMLEEEMEGQAFAYGHRVGGAIDWFTYLIENWETVWKAIQAIILILGKAKGEEGDA